MLLDITNRLVGRGSSARAQLAQMCSQQSVLSATKLAVMLSLAFLAILLANSNANAQQTAFNIKPQVQETEFSYAWTNKDKNYNLSFSIPSAALIDMPSSPAAYSKRVFQEAVYSQVMQEAKRIDPRLAKVNVERKYDGLSFNVQSKKSEQAQLVLNRLSAAHDQAQKDYYTNNYFAEYSSPTGEQGIRHDHAKYTELSSPALIAVVEAIKEIQQQPGNPREFVEIALSWIQSIPYDKLENRISSNGSGFISPRDLLMQNKGDCDSKSTLMAAILKAYSPRINVEMVYLRNHALLAVAMPSMPRDQTINKKGIKYVLLEPTGPAQLGIGEVDDDTKMALRNRQFDTTAL